MQHAPVVEEDRESFGIDVQPQREVVVVPASMATDGATTRRLACGGSSAGSEDSAVTSEGVRVPATANAGWSRTTPGWKTARR